MQMNNLEIRTAITKRRLRYCEVAQALHIHPVTFSKWLQLELPPEKKKAILEVINGIKL